MKYPYGKNVLITGASSGLGLKTAELFAQNGFSVWAVSRRAKQEDKPLGTGVIHSRKMDVTDDASVEQTVREIISEAGRIGIVIHCAGFGIGGAAEDTPMADAVAQMDTNYFGVLRVNRVLLPSMREAGGGLVLVTSSVAGLLSIPFQSHYSASKYALEAYVEALRLESGSFGIRAALIEPGDTKTGFTSARKMTIPQGSPYEKTCKRSVAKMEHDEQNGKPPESFAQIALKLSQSKNPPIRKVIGFDYKVLVFLKRLLPTRLIAFVLKKMYVDVK